MKNEIKRGAVLGYINILAKVIVTLLYTPFMLSKLGDSEYGLYSLVYSVVAYLSILDMGFGNAMIRYVSKSISDKVKEKENKINGLFLIFYLIIAVIALVIGAIIYLNFEHIFHNSLTTAEIAKAKIIMIILVITVALSFPLSVFDSYIISNEKFTFIKILNVIKTIMLPLTMLPLLLNGYKSITMVLVNSAFNIGFHILTMYYCFKKLHMGIDFRLNSEDKRTIKEITAYSFFIFLGIIVDNIFDHTDQVILGVVSGTFAVSVYAIAIKITTMNQDLSTTISGLFLPKVTKLLNDNESDQKISNIFIAVSRIQIYLMLLILSGFYIFGDKFLVMWVGKEYLDAYYIILILIGPSIIPLTQNIGISVIQAKKIHQFRAILYLIIAILNIFLSIPLAKMYGGIGAAIGTGISNVLGQIISMNIFYWKKAKLDIPLYWKCFLRMFIPTLVLACIYRVGLSYVSNNYIAIGVMVTYVLLYFVICNFNFNSYERDLVKLILNKMNIKNILKNRKRSRA